MATIRHGHLRLLVAVAAAGAFIVIGGVAALAPGQHQPGIVIAGPMTVGATATSTTPPTTPVTSIASPVMKAPRPKGF